jgi:CubicO group peptidase (beta-lactamase class C family)
LASWFYNDFILIKDTDMKTFYFFLPLFFAVRVNAQNLINRFDSLTLAYVRNNFQGVVLVAKEDSVIYNKAWGYADLDKKIELRATTLFKMESTGKMFTATAIMQLVENGKLHLNNTVKEILPELPLKNAGKITIHHLLTHTSGLASPWDAPDYNFKKAYSQQEFEKIISDMPMVFDTPGNEMYYSNSGYIILSWIIEKISGQSFDDYLSTHFFKPQQMANIRHLNDTMMPPGEAQPYRFVNSKRYISQNDIISPKANGAGGWLANAKDLYRFMLGFDENKYLQPATLKIMRTANGTKPFDSSFHGYAYGLEVYNNEPLKGVSYFGHSGGGAGFSIDAMLEPLSHTIIIFCSNTFINSREVSRNYLSTVLNRPVAEIKIPNTIRVYDMVEEKGIADFIKNEKQYFRVLNIIPDERLFTGVGDAMEMTEDYNNLVLWTDLGTRYFPENGFLFLMEGSGYAKLNDKSKAIKCFETVKTIATKNKDNRMLDEAVRRIKLIQ